MCPRTLCPKKYHRVLILKLLLHLTITFVYLLSKYLKVLFVLRLISFCIKNNNLKRWFLSAISFLLALNSVIRLFKQYLMLVKLMHESTNQFEWHLFDICDQTFSFMNPPGVKESLLDSPCRYFPDRMLRWELDNCSKSWDPYKGWKITYLHSSK